MLINRVHSSFCHQKNLNLADNKKILEHYITLARIFLKYKKTLQHSSISCKLDIKIPNTIENMRQVRISFTLF